MQEHPTVEYIRALIDGTATSRSWLDSPAALLPSHFPPGHFEGLLDGFGEGFHYDLDEDSSCDSDSECGDEAGKRPEHHSCCRSLEDRDEDSLRWICPRLEPSRTAAPERIASVGSLGDLFTNNGYANLLQLVICHVPDRALLRLSKVCTNAGLVISKSTPAQLRLRRLFHAVRPDDVLHPADPSPAAQLAWLLERELRSEQVRAHHSSLGKMNCHHYYYQIDRAYIISHVWLPSDGEDSQGGAANAQHGDATRDFHKFALIHESNTEHSKLSTWDERDRQGLPNKATMWLYKLDSKIATAVVSARDDLMIQAQFQGDVDASDDEGEQNVWRLRFCRMRPIGGSETAEPECEAQPHPLARLPAIDIVIPSFGGRERRLDLKVGPGGLALFSVTCDDFALHHVTVILDWVKGEGRGYIMTQQGEAGKATHAFVNEEYLISAVSGDMGKPGEGVIDLELHCADSSRSNSWAALWLWAVPQGGRRPQAISWNVWGHTAGITSLPSALCLRNLQRLEPEVSFDLPAISDARQLCSASRSQHFLVDHTSVSTTPVQGRELEANADLALFSFVGTVSSRVSRSRIRPVQCSGVVQLSKLIDAWHRTRVADVEANDTRRTARRKMRIVPIHTVAWRDWQQWTHIFTLNSHLEPVLHGTKVIIGFSPKEEICAPSMPAQGMDGPYGVSFPQLVLAIRDFNTNRLTNRGLRPWHKLGAPLSHSSQPSSDTHDIPDCALPTFDTVMHRVTRGPAHQTRGMFLDQVIRGGLQYHEVTASTDSKLAKSWRKMGIRLDDREDGGRRRPTGVVEEMMYDGETLILELPETAVTVDLGPRRDGDGLCCLIGNFFRKMRTAI